MHYFELYNIPIGLSIDQALLKKKYYQLSKQYHPDYQLATTDDATQQVQLQQAAMVNEGYKVLQYGYATLEYVLLLKGIITPNEKYVLPPQFLMQVMDLNEDVVTNQAEIKKLEEALYASVAALLQLQDVSTLEAKDWELLKLYYYQQKYINRLLQRVAGNDVEI